MKVKTSNFRYRSRFLLKEFTNISHWGIVEYFHNFLLNCWTSMNDNDSDTNKPRLFIFNGYLEDCTSCKRHVLSECLRVNKWVKLITVAACVSLNKCLIIRVFRRNSTESFCFSGRCISADILNVMHLQQAEKCFCFSKKKQVVQIGGCSQLTLTDPLTVVIVTQGAFGSTETRGQQSAVGGAGSAGERPRPTAGLTWQMASWVKKTKKQKRWREVV